MGRNSSRLHLMSIKVCRLLSSCEEVLMGHRVLFPKRIAYMRKDCVTSPWRVARDHCTGTIIFLSRGGWKISNENKLLSKKKLFKESHVGKIEQVRSTIQVLFLMLEKLFLVFSVTPFQNSRNRKKNQNRSTD